jgi:tRNA-Thr(GGU) m(6)t(6)A37 methyltransferase TsaA
MTRSRAKQDRKKITCTPIGVIHSEHTAAEQTPIQPAYAKGCPGRVEVFPEYAEGLKDLDGFSHIILLYHFHVAGEPKLIVQPFLEDVPKGVFATRHPERPNRIGFSVVRLLRIERTSLLVEDVDVINGTPLLDIKPYVPRFDLVKNACGGWTDRVPQATARKRGRRGYPGKVPGPKPDP